MTPKLDKGVRVSGDHRSAVAAGIKQRYLAGETIRAIAADVGRSYGFVHGILREQDVPLRPRGGDTRSRKRPQVVAVTGPLPKRR